MSRINWSHWLGSEQDAHDKGVLGLLHRIETVFVRMLQGIPLFFLETIPDFWKVLRKWLHRMFYFAVRAGVRLLRVALASTAWMVIVIGPFYVFGGIIAFCWMGFGLVASVWGLCRDGKKRRAATANLP